MHTVRTQHIDCEVDAVIRINVRFCLLTRYDVKGKSFFCVPHALLFREMLRF